MRIQRHQTLAVIGQGYVGLPLSMAAVNAGWDVIGIDHLESKVDLINSGMSPIEDIADFELMAAIESNAYKATTDFSLVSQASVITICVPTPLGKDRKPDLTFLIDAITKVSPYISDETLLVSESTSYPGTLREVIIPIISRLKAKDAEHIYFASAPERVNPGDQFWNQKNTPRLIGAINDVSRSKALSFYESICDSSIAVSTPEVAEAAKLLENTFRLVNIALVNEFAQICASSGISVHDVIDAASSKPYGFMPFRPGVGVGGHCIPVDPLYLTWWARKNGRAASFVEVADQINRGMPKYIAERALSMVAEAVTTPKVLILGVAYKPGVRDVRETPVSELRKCLEAEGAEVIWHDPLVKVWEGTESADLTTKCDVAILATNQPDMEIELITQKGVQILDCTNSANHITGVISL